MSDAAPDLDLNSCDREPIHIPGLIQPLGVLLAIDADEEVVRASANCGRLFGPPAAVLGRSLTALLDERALHDLRGRIQVAGLTGETERLFALPLQPDGPPQDVAVHRSDTLMVLEFEPSDIDRSVDPVAAVKGMMARLNRVERTGEVFDAAARQLRAILGYSRVMVYRFEDDQSDTGPGVVVGESVAPGQASFRGHHYPGSDIPRQARELYRRNWLRMIADSAAAPVPILPVGAPPLDLTHSTLRAVSPIHIEYLRNMGVVASLSISILRRDRLWGLFACHADRPTPVSYQRRSAVELFGQLFSLQLESREQGDLRAYEQHARHIHERITTTVVGDADVFTNLRDIAGELRDLIPCDGVAVTGEGRMHTDGRTPTREELLGLTRFLDGRASDRVFAEHRLGRVYPPAADFPERAAGLLAIPFSRAPRGYVLFFRGEKQRTVTWAGDPTKPAVLGPNGLRLTPRKSFDAWQEVMRGASDVWTEPERQAAESLRVTLLEVIVRLAGTAEVQRRNASQRQDLLIAELNHRVRNILGLIRALVSQSQDSARSLENFVTVLSDRIGALALANDLLTSDQWRPVPLRSLLMRELAAYLVPGSERVTLEGPPALIDPQAFTVLALVLHELATNAAKYGGLASKTGAVAVEWSFDGDDRFVLDWRESGGPPVRAPKRQGFGSTLIERSIPFELEGEARVDYAVTGLLAHFRIPARWVAPSDSDPEPEIAALGVEVADVTLTGSALVVEDNALIAFDADEMLRRLGFGEVEIASSAAQALDLLASWQPDFAMLDLNLGTGNAVPVALELRRRGVPFVFATGYGEQARLPDSLAGSVLVSKPYREENVATAAAQAIGLTRTRAAGD